MRGHVVDTLAVDVDLSSVAQAGEIFRARERPPLRADGVLGLLGAHGGGLLPRSIAGARHSRRRVSMCPPIARSPEIGVPSAHPGTSLTLLGRREVHETVASAAGRCAAPPGRERSAARLLYARARPRASRGRSRTAGPT